MSNPIRICKACEEAFELKADKPGLPTHCPACSATKANVMGHVRIVNRQDKLKRLDFFIRFCAQDKERGERLGDSVLVAMRDKEIKMLSQAKRVLADQIGKKWDA